MATASVQYTFAALTDIKSSEANKNFTDLVNFLNNQVIHSDASRVFTATPSGPALDPVSDNQFVRKAYVDSGLQSWTPTWVGVTLGAGATNVGRYWKIGREINYVAHLILGAGGDVTANIALDWNGQMPAAHADFAANNFPGAIAWADKANDRYAGVGLMTDGINTRVSRFVGHNTNVAWAVSQPFDWVSGTQLNVMGKYLTS